METFKNLNVIVIISIILLILAVWYYYSRGEITVTKRAYDVLSKYQISKLEKIKKYTVWEKEYIAIDSPFTGYTASLYKKIPSMIEPNTLIYFMKNELTFPMYLWSIETLNNKQFYYPEPNSYIYSDHNIYYHGNRNIYVILAKKERSEASANFI